MEPMDVLRALALGERGLRPREPEVETVVEGLLGRRHGVPFAVGGSGPVILSSRSAARLVLQRKRQPRYLAGEHRGHLEAHIEPAAHVVRVKPRARRAANAATLLGADGRDGPAEGVAGALLHLDEDEQRAPA